MARLIRLSITAVKTMVLIKLVHRLMDEFMSFRMCDLVLISWVCKDYFQSCQDPILLEQDIAHRRGEHLGSHELKLLVL